MAKLHMKLRDQPIAVLVVDPETPRQPIHEQALPTDGAAFLNEKPLPLKHSPETLSVVAQRSGGSDHSQQRYFQKQSMRHG